MQGRPLGGIPPEEARRQRLLQVVFVVVLAITMIVVAASLAPFIDPPWSATTASITGLIGLTYVAGLVVLRRGHTQAAGLMLAVGVVLGSWLPATLPGGISGPRSYVFTATSVMVASFALSARAGAVVAGINLAGLTALWYTRIPYTTGQYAEDVLLMSVFSAIMIAVARVGEIDRRAIQEGRSELLEALDAQRALMDNSPDAVVALGPDHRVMSANRLAQQWAAERFRVHLMPGADLRAMLPREAGQQWQSLLDEARRCGAVRSEVLWEDDGPNWYQIFVHATATGGTTVQVRDVSQERRAEIHARQAYRDRVEIEKLREMDAFRLRLLNTASHELRTPITPLRLQVSILRRHLQGRPDAAHSLEVLERNVDRLAVLVDDLLDVARLEGDQLRLEKQSIELDAFLARELEGYHEVASQRGIDIVFRPASGATVQADPGRLAQVFTNLLTNALKYGADGGRIDVVSRMHGGLVTVEVRDDGAGFSPARAPDLFQPFMQIHDGSERRDGTGLGLFICRGIIERHGGTIWGRSDGPGHGASFGFSLPARATLKQELSPVVPP